MSYQSIRLPLLLTSSCRYAEIKEVKCIGQDLSAHCREARLITVGLCRLYYHQVARDKSMGVIPLNYNALFTWAVWIGITTVVHIPGFSHSVSASMASCCWPSYLRKDERKWSVSFGGMLSAPFALNYKICLLYRVQTQTQSMQRKIKFLFFPSLPSNPRPLGKHGPHVSRKASASFPIYRELFLHVPKYRQPCGCLGVHTDIEKPNSHLNKP